MPTTPIGNFPNLIGAMAGAQDKLKEDLLYVSDIKHIQSIKRGDGIASGKTIERYKARMLLPGHSKRQP